MLKQGRTDEQSREFVGYEDAENQPCCQLNSRSCQFQIAALVTVVLLILADKGSSVRVQEIEHAEGRKTLELELNYGWAHFFLARACLQKGMAKEAFTEFKEWVSLQPNFPKAQADIALAYAAIGDRKTALKIYEQLKQQSKREYVTPYPMARVCLHLGRKEEALAWLQKDLAINDGDMNQINVDPDYDGLRSDPRFQDLLRHMKFHQWAVGLDAPTSRLRQNTRRCEVLHDVPASWLLTSLRRVGSWIDKHLVNEHLRDDIGEFTTLSGFCVLPPVTGIPLHGIHANRDAVDRPKSV